MDAVECRSKVRKVQKQTNKQQKSIFLLIGIRQQPKSKTCACSSFSGTSFVTSYTSIKVEIFLLLLRRGMTGWYFFFSTFPLAFIMLHYISRNAWTPQWLYDYNCAVYSKSCILSGIFFFQISLRRLFKKDLIIVTSVGLILNFTQ